MNEDPVSVAESVLALASSNPEARYWLETAACKIACLDKGFRRELAWRMRAVKVEIMTELLTGEPRSGDPIDAAVSALKRCA